MKRWAILLWATLAACALPALSDDDLEKGGLTASFKTLITTPLAIEGLTSDDNGNLYAPGRSVTPGEACPVYRVNIDNPVLTIVGLIPPPSATGLCSPSGLAFDAEGNLYVTQTDRIFVLKPAASSPPPTAALFASGVPGTNGLAFDRDGNLWTGDGTTGAGRVWRITKAKVVTEMLRIPPMANEVGLAAGVGGIGRDIRTLPPGTITVTATSRNAANTLGSQPLVANGVQFDRRGNLLVADTARGAIWKVRFKSDGSVASSMGCDTTFTPNTLCLSNVLVAHPYLEGADGFVLDVAGNIWVDANERNAVIYVQSNGLVWEVFRNPADPATQLRNTGPLETPASPVLAGNRFCTSNSDGNRRDNSPATAGEISPAGPLRGKISCMEQRITVPGVKLPVR
jgi:sugar lactone lactonase YvrE